MIIIDSQGEMLRSIERLKLFAADQRLADRIVIIDPEDVDHPPALNMFDMKLAQASLDRAAPFPPTLMRGAAVLEECVQKMSSKSHTLTFINRLMP